MVPAAYYQNRQHHNAVLLQAIPFLKKRGQAQEIWLPTACPLRQNQRKRVEKYRAKKVWKSISGYKNPFQKKHYFYEQ